MYAVDPSDFMATRKQLVADLRAAGDAGAAKELGAARRPTNAAWALNQLARRHGDLVDQFLEQSRALREAQDQAVSGRPDELRSATRAQRDALAAVTQAANTVLGKGMTEAYRAQIAATLQAASVDDATAEVLRQGRVVREVSGATGFPDAGGFSLADVEETTAAKGTRSRLPRARESGDAKTRESGDSKANEQRAPCGGGAGVRRGVAAQRGGRAHVGRGSPPPPPTSASRPFARSSNARGRRHAPRPKPSTMLAAPPRTRRRRSSAPAGPSRSCREKES